MKILVTGGSGFLGSHVADALTKVGHDVVIFDRQPSRFADERQKVITGDISDAKAVADAVAGCNVVYHMAALADINEAMNNPAETVRVNVMGTLNVLEAARHADVSRVVLASSIYVYSSQGSFYRTSKQASELLVQDYQERFGLPFTILRFGSLYGPRASETNTVHRLISEALTWKRMTYGGTGDEVREYIHVADAAAGSVDILAPEFNGEIIHLTGRERIKTREMLEMIREIAGGDVSVETGNGSIAGHYVQTPYSFVPRLGKKLARSTYIDLGLGLLECMNTISQQSMDDTGETKK